MRHQLLFLKISSFLFVLILLFGGHVSKTYAECRNTGDFSEWLNEFADEAKAVGISDHTVNSALHKVKFSKKVIEYDRKQKVFSQPFLEFAGRMVNEYRLVNGRKHLAENKAKFRKIERDYGVPAPVLVAFWGLETDFGANIGNFSTLTALATLAYDCRRPDLFRQQFMDALRIIERGDLRPSEMVGAWAGELGQMQFLPSEYLVRGVDFNKDGRVNLLKNPFDALASSAALLKHHGWKPDEPWLEEVRVPEQLPWEQADIKISHTRSQWSKWGVKKRDGNALTQDDTFATLILPMGKNGPAFLAYDNFHVYLKWNRSFVYATTAAYFATRLDGAPKVSNGRGNTQTLSFEQVKLLQQKLEKRGYDVGGIDGTIGSKTRAAVKEVQELYGFPADSYPTIALLNKL